MKRWAILAVVAFALAAGSLIQARAWTQTSHFALVRALAHGTAVIDPWHEETGDKAWVNGHFYSVKAPGLALLVLPEYLVLRAVGAVPDGIRPAIWELTLLGAVLPAALLLVLVRREAEDVGRGQGLRTAGALGLGTMLFPFATLLFSHVLAALFAFAAFAVLLRERRVRGSPRLAAAAGVLAGAAALAEYPAAIAGVVLGGLVLASPRRAARAAAYGAGFAIPLAILAAYNRWAFGSFTHLSYKSAVIVPGRTGHDVVGATSDGFFGVTAPSFRVIVDLFLAGRGFLALTPVVGVALAGLVLLYRERWRAEALVAAAVFGAFLLYNSGIKTTFGGPFGGDSPGPRYLVVALPFLALGLAAAVRRAPGSAAALTAASVLSMAAVTATKPLLEPDEGLGTALRLVREGDFTKTVLTPLGLGSGWIAILPFLVITVTALTLFWWRPPKPSPHVAATAVVALAAWILVAVTAPPMLGDGAGPPSWRVAAGVTAVALAGAAVVVATEARRYAAALGLLPLAAARLGFERPGLVLLLAACSLVLVALVYAAEATRIRPSASEGRAQYRGRTAVR